MSGDRRQPGDECQCGRGRLRVYSSRDLGEFVHRYIECKACGFKDRQTVKADCVKSRRTPPCDGLKRDE